MINSKNKSETIDEYISQFPEDVRAILEEIRQTVRQAAPEAQETIKYGMPTFTLDGNLVYFAAFKHHIGFYPPVAAFQKESALYKASKGTLRFPLDQPMPLSLIRKIVKYRAKENRARKK